MKESIDQQTLEEGWQAQWPKCHNNNNKGKDISLTVSHVNKCNKSL